MAWTAKNATYVLNTGHSLYTSCVAYAPLLEGSGALKELKNNLTSSAASGTGGWVTEGGYVGVEDTGADASGWNFSTFSPLTGASAFSLVSWFYLGNVNPWVGAFDTMSLGFGKWETGGTHLLNRWQGDPALRLIMECSTTNVDSGAVNYGSNFVQGENTLIWTCTIGSALACYVNGTSLSISGPTLGDGTVKDFTADSVDGLQLFAAAGSMHGFQVTDGVAYGSAIFNAVLDASARADAHTYGPMWLMTAPGGATTGTGTGMNRGLRRGMDRHMGRLTV